MKSWRARLLLLAFAASAVLTVVFAMRAVRHAPHRHRNPDANAPIRPWMSVPFIAHTHGVPPRVLYDALGLPATKPHDKRPLRDIARAQHRPVEAVIADLQQAIAKEKRPPPSIEQPPPAQTSTDAKPPRTTTQEKAQ